jgi:hypothetical protein
MPGLGQGLKRKIRNQRAKIVKNPRSENVTLFGAPWKGARSVPSDHGVVGVMEYWSNENAAQRRSLVGVACGVSAAIFSITPFIHYSITPYERNHHERKSHCL